MTDSEPTTYSVTELLHQNTQLKAALTPFADLYNHNYAKAKSTQKVNVQVQVGDIRVAAYALGRI